MKDRRGQEIKRIMLINRAIGLLTGTLEGLEFKDVRIEGVKSTIKEAIELLEKTL